MKAYIITTGIIFGLIFIAHLCRIFLENAALGRDPFFLLLTVLTAALCAWSWRLVWRMRRPS